MILVAQSIADLILDFRAVTGADTEIGIVLKQPDSSPRPRRIAALTNQQALGSLLEHLADRYPKLDRLSEKFIPWRGAIYAVHSIPLTRLIEAPEGKILLITNVTLAVHQIRQAALSVLFKNPR